MSSRLGSGGVPFGGSALKCVVTGGVVGGAVPPAALRCAGDEIHGDLDVTHPSLEVTMATAGT